MHLGHRKNGRNEVLMKTFGLLGKSLAHSFSKSYFETKFQNLQLSYSYKNFELEQISDVTALLNQKSISGLNVTIPYKEDIIPYLDELSEEAEIIGAVNTIEFSNNKRIGHNTDHIGFSKAIKPFFTSNMSRALILGTGGASKAISYALKQLGVDCLSVSRNPISNAISYEDINEHVLKHHLLIVHTTPVGTYPDIANCIKFPFEFLTEKHLVVDLIYNPKETLFLKKANASGAITLNGHAMLVHQAEASWVIWNS